jgi:hypothetical protein
MLNQINIAGNIFYGKKLTISPKVPVQKIIEHWNGTSLYIYPLSVTNTSIKRTYPDIPTPPENNQIFKILRMIQKTS